MDTVTEARLAIALAQEGGMGIIHKNMSIQAQTADQVHLLKNTKAALLKTRLRLLLIPPLAMCWR